jgi:hypothetical protein
MPNSSPSNYFAYLVRLWRADKTAGWRAIAQDPHTGHIFHFDSPESLFDFLQQQLSESPPVPTPVAPLTLQDAVDTSSQIQDRI